MEFSNKRQRRASFLEACLNDPSILELSSSGWFRSSKNIMDPLSIVASAIGLIEAARRISRGIQRLIELKRVPTILLALNNEMSDLQVILAQIESFAPSLASKPQDRSLSHNVVLINEKLKELELIVYGRLMTKGGGMNRAAWLLVRDDVERIQKEIRHLRVNIGNSLNIMT